MSFDDLYLSLERIQQPEFSYICVGALALLFILILLLRRQPRKVVAYTTENGSVMVSRHAIVELVQTSCEQLQDVSKPHIKIKIKGDTTHFDIRIKLLGGGRLREVEETLQTHLRHALTENLGIEALGQINIVATGFKSGRVDSSLPTKPHSPGVKTTDPHRVDEPLELDEPDETPKTP